MNKRRRLWLIYGVCSVAMVLALVWLTMTVVRLQDAENEALASADHQERLRLAMWRMDSWLAPIIAREASRPYHEYQSFYAPSRAYTNMLNRLEPGEIITPSPLLSFESDLFRVHFQVAPDGTLTSPQAPTGNLRELAEDLPGSEERLANIANELSLCGVSMEPEALGQCVATGESSLTSMDSEIDSTQAATEPQALQQLDLSAQLARTQQELASRRRAYAWNAANLDAAVDDGLSDGVFIGPLVPIWSDSSSQAAERDLLFVRRVSVQGEEYFQGFLCDWPVLRNELLEKITDLFPVAQLAPVDVVPDETNLGVDVLATVPAAMVVERDSTAGPILSGIAGVALIFSWLAVIAGLGATAVTLRSSINFGQRRSRFASAVTHELRTPLTTFKMYTEMLADDMVTDEDQRRRYLLTLRNESGRLSALVENVLSYARLDEGRHALPTRRMHIAELVEYVTPTLTRRADQADMQLSVSDNAPDDVEVLTDADAVGQILFNLVDNACKYAADASDRRIELIASAENGCVHFDVRDRGPGISASRGGRIFKAFDRGENDTSEAPGIGLGLALSRDLARELGGSLELASKAGDSGALFRLSLPVVPGD